MLNCKSEALGMLVIIASLSTTSAGFADAGSDELIWTKYIDDGLTYQTTRDNDKALENYQRALSEAKIIDAKGVHVIVSLCELSTQQEAMSQLKEAESSIREASELAAALGGRAGKVWQSYTLEVLIGFLSRHKSLDEKERVIAQKKVLDASVAADPIDYSSTLESVYAKVRKSLHSPKVKTNCSVAVDWQIEKNGHFDLVHTLASSGDVNVDASVISAVRSMSDKITLPTGSLDPIGSRMTFQFKVDASDLAGTKSNKVQFYQNLAELDFEKSDFAKAVEHCSKGIECDPKDAVIWNTRGAAYLQQHQYKEAIADISQAITLNPNYQIAYIDRAIAEQALSQYDASIADCLKAKKIDPKFAPSYSTLSISYLRTGRYDKVLEECDQALSLDPKSGDAYCNRGMAQYNLHNYDAAIDDCTKAASFEPENGDIFSTRGASYLFSGKLRESLQDCNKGVALSPRSSVGYRFRGAVQLKLGNYREAISDLTKAIELGDATGENFYRRSACYEQIGNHDLAVADFNKSQSLGYAPKISPVRHYHLAD